MEDRGIYTEELRFKKSDTPFIDLLIFDFGFSFFPAISDFLLSRRPIIDFRRLGFVAPVFVSIGSCKLFFGLPRGDLTVSNL